MFITLKSIHFLALLLGGASTLGSVVMQRSLQRSGHTGALPAPVTIATRVFPLLGLAAIVLLWATGLWMFAIAYQGQQLGILFTVKLALATIILGGALLVNVTLARAARGGPAPNPRLIRLTASTIRICLVLAVIMAVVTFA